MKTALIATALAMVALLPWLLTPAHAIEADMYCYNPNYVASNLNQWVPCPTTSITGNATGSTGAVVGTLAAATGKTTFICGFNVSAIGGTAAVGPITIANLIGSSMVFQLAATASGSFVGTTFSPCIPANAVNTAITITTTADGSATGVDVNSWGYQQ